MEILRQSMTNEEWDNIVHFIVKSKSKSHFFDLPVESICNSSSHNPPTHLHIPQGKGYRHICPICDKETVIIPPQITL